jgi:hypothetical protein
MQESRIDQEKLWDKTVLGFEVPGAEQPVRLSLVG